MAQSWLLGIDRSVRIQFRDPIRSVHENFNASIASVAPRFMRPILMPVDLCRPMLIPVDVLFIDFLGYPYLVSLC
jgi:hypothetical protein